MTNYALDWKKSVKLRDLPYGVFISKFMKAPSFYSIEKVDGQLGALVYREGKSSFFQSTGGGIVSDIPAIYEYETILKRAGIKQAILIGDLVAMKFGTVLPFNQTESIVKRFHVTENKPLIHHFLFDVYSFDRKRIKDYRQALSILGKYFDRKKLVNINIPKIAYGDIRIFRKLYVDTKDSPGFDGVVVRLVDGKNYKVKYTANVDLVVIGAGHERLPSWPRKQVSYLLTSFIDSKGIFRTSSKVGTGFTASERSFFFKYINERSLYDENGEIFIRPEMIIQVKYYRVRITKTPAYRFTKDRYEAVGDELSATLSHPSFERIREDKKPTKFDVRLEQIPSFEE